MAFVLVADDVTVARETLARALRERGHLVATAVDGQEAVERFQRELPEAAVLDVNMPRLSGIDAAAHIKATPLRHTPVILVSSRADLESRLAALAVADDFVAKPYEASEIAARLEAQLRTRRFVEELRQGRTSDPTGLRTRVALLERLNEEWLRSVRFNEPLSLLLLAPDSADPSVLPSIAAAAQKILRQIDVTARYQPHQLCSLLPNTHVTGALVAATRLKRELARGGATLGAAMGIAFYPGRDIAEQSDLIRIAERALARAREEGPGSICIYQHQGYLFHPAE